MVREHQKSVSSQKRFDAYLKAAQQSAGAQIDARCDINLARIDDKAKCIIKDTIKSKSIKREALSFYILSLTNAHDFSGVDNINRVNLVPPAHNAITNKRMRQQGNAIDPTSPIEKKAPLKARFQRLLFHNFQSHNLQPQQYSANTMHPEIVSRSQVVLIFLEIICFFFHKIFYLYAWIPKNIHLGS